MRVRDTGILKISHKKTGTYFKKCLPIRDQQGEKTIQASLNLAIISLAHTDSMLYEESGQTILTEIQASPD